MDINEYFSNPKYFKNKIIVVSAKDEASRYVGKIHSKEHLGLNMEIGYRNSYVAVVDYRRAFVFEHAAKDEYKCSYRVGRRFIDISSAGFGNGNHSSIKIGEKEYSFDKRGFNVAVFHYRTLELVDNFYVDVNSDSSLEVKKG